MARRRSHLSAPEQARSGNRAASGDSDRHTALDRAVKRSDTEARTIKYIAILHKDRTSDFWVSFPDFPGCITGARALEPARPRAREGFQQCITDMRETGEALPSRCYAQLLHNSSDKRTAERLALWEIHRIVGFLENRPLID